MEDEGFPELLLERERAYNRCVEAPTHHTNDSLYCKRTFDGWSCWNDTPAGQISYLHCPAFITGFDPRRLAHKVCLEDGTWFRHPLTNTTWSNYTTCVDIEDLALRRTINTVNIVGYSVSLLALLLSLCIFFYFKSLNCTRINIHKNLFMSFIMNNGIWIIWYAVMESPQLLFQNESGCQILHVVLHYFLVCNYFWMFCEGMYLHTILVVAFVDKESIMKWLYLIGWGIPAVLALIYAAVRSSFPTETVHCWINDSPYFYILTAPIAVSMLANLVFLVNIVKVLVTKLRAVKSSDTDQTRKAVRATIILIPLLGLHLVVTPFRPEPGASGESLYGIVAAVVTSFQGLCVSLLFCFCNGEIISLIRKKWLQSVRGQHPSLYVSTMTTVPSCRGDSIRYNSTGRSLHRGTGAATTPDASAPPRKRTERLRNHIHLSDMPPPKLKTSKRRGNPLTRSLKTYKMKRTSKMAVTANAVAAAVTEAERNGHAVATVITVDNGCATVDETNGVVSNARLQGEQPAMV